MFLIDFGRELKSLGPWTWKDCSLNVITRCVAFLPILGNSQLLPILDSELFFLFYSTIRNKVFQSFPGVDDLITFHSTLLRVHLLNFKSYPPILGLRTAKAKGFSKLSSIFCIAWFCVPINYIKYTFLFILLLFSSEHLNCALCRLIIFK